MTKRNREQSPKNNIERPFEVAVLRDKETTQKNIIGRRQLRVPPEIKKSAAAFATNMQRIIDFASGEFEDFPGNGTAIEELQALRDYLGEIVRAAIIPDNSSQMLPGVWRTTEIDIGDGLRTYRVQQLQKTAGVELAVRLLAFLDSCQNQFRDETDAANFLAGIEAGRYVEALNVLPNESHTWRGKRMSERNRRNNSRRSADADVRKLSRRVLVEKEMDRQIQADERPNYHKALKLAAQTEGCSLETVKNSVPNRWTKRAPK